MDVKGEEECGLVFSGLRHGEVMFCCQNGVVITIYVFNGQWAVAQWQWLLCIYINVKCRSKKFKSGGLHEKHAVAIWSVGNHLGIRF
jgi:hypothetical protein